MLPCEREGCEERVRVELLRGAQRGQGTCAKCGHPQTVPVLGPLPVFVGEPVPPSQRLS